MEYGRPPESFATRDSRVAWPSAANTGARACCLTTVRLPRLCDMFLYVLHLLSPAAVIHAECFEAAVPGNLVEAGLCEHQQGAARGFLKPEFDERGRLFRVICFRIDSIRMPGEGKEPFRLHFLHHGLPLDVLVTRMGNVSARNLPRHKWAIQFHSKPLAKLTVVRQRAPDPRNRCRQFDPLLNAVIRVKQPLGCILCWRRKKMQPRGSPCCRTLPTAEHTRVPAPLACGRTKVQN